MTRPAILCVLAAGLCSVSEAQTFSGKVVGVTDGDTVRVLDTRNGQKRPVKVRLHGIDAPERAQPFGTRSQQFLSKLVFGKTVQVVTKDTDRYGRTVAVLKLGAKNVNVESLRAGMSWWYRRYAQNDQTLVKAEADARRARRGLWSDTKPPVAPWEFRRSQRQ
jgi:endonuclease YncB( thermonuclease family)